MADGRKGLSGSFVLSSFCLSINMTVCAKNAIICGFRGGLTCQKILIIRSNCRLDAIVLQRSLLVLDDCIGLSEADLSFLRGNGAEGVPRPVLAGSYSGYCETLASDGGNQ